MIRKPIDEAVPKEWVHLHKVIKYKIITATVSGKYCLETGRARKEEKKKRYEETSGMITIILTVIMVLLMSTSSNLNLNMYMLI